MNEKCVPSYASVSSNSVLLASSLAFALSALCVRVYLAIAVDSLVYINVFFVP